MVRHGCEMCIWDEQRDKVTIETTEMATLGYRLRRSASRIGWFTLVQRFFLSCEVYISSSSLVITEDEL
jgi:hypothetical protein